MGESQPSTPSAATAQSAGYFDHSHGGHSGTGSHHAGNGSSHFVQPPLEILLESDHLIMRGAGSDYNPTLMSGEVVLHLTESTNIKQLDLRLEGKAKVAFVEGSG